MIPRPSVVEQLFEIDLGQLLRTTDILSEDGADELALLFGQLENLFFDRPLGDETVRGDHTRLTDAVGAVGRLIFDRRVPPRSWKSICDATLVLLAKGKPSSISYRSIGEQRR